MTLKNLADIGRLKPHSTTAKVVTPAQIVAEHPDLEEEGVRQALAHTANRARERIRRNPA